MRIILLAFLSILLINSCQKDDFISGDNLMLKISTDTVMFDTVFTSIGSATKHFKAINPYDKILKINSIRLSNGNNSPFRLNIDGNPSNIATNLELNPGDSIYIFVEVNIDPLNSNSPLIVDDSIVFSIGQSNQSVKLVAFGQDVYLFNGQIIPVLSSDTVWSDSLKPYLIYNSILVDTLKSLRITEGCKIHFHYNSSLLVKGKLLVEGSKKSPVVFRGDRLEHFYDNIPGQWGAFINLDQDNVYFLGGIHFLQGSNNNSINWAIIQNATKGIMADSTVTPGIPTLTLSNTIIGNMSLAGIHAQGTSILASNCEISNCGLMTLALTVGGQYEFYHCTLANYYYDGSRRSPSVYLNNYFKSGGTTYQRPFLAQFANCIISGGYTSTDTELEMDMEGTAGIHYMYTFDHCLIKIPSDFNTSDTNMFKSIFKYKTGDPLFKTINYPKYNFSLDTLSVAKDKGSLYWGNYFPTDLNNQNRLGDGHPDLGAYERIE